MQQYGLIGHPLGHSFSAAFFAEKFAREHIDARYENFDLAEVNALRDWVSAHPELVGFNVTIPHKQAVVPQLDSLSLEAEAVGAVNVVRVRRTDGGGLRLDGHNSDLLGFTRSIAPLLCPHHRRGADYHAAQLRPPVGRAQQYARIHAGNVFHGGRELNFLRRQALNHRKPWRRRRPPTDGKAEFVSVAV